MSRAGDGELRGHQGAGRVTDEIIIFHGWHILAYPLTRVKINIKLVEGVTYVPHTP